MKKEAKKESAKKGKKFLKAYFIIVIVFALLGLLGSFIFKGIEYSNPFYLLWSLFIGLFSLTIFVLSIIALVIFAKNKWPKITLVLPIYYLVILVGSFLTGLVLASLSIEISSVNSFFKIFGIACSFFELIFSIYLLSKTRA